MIYYNTGGELTHYGVLGMKWGVRRYQNPDGTLTAEGRRRARKEYREDNRKAFELGRDATILGNARKKSIANLERTLEKALKEPTDTNLKKLAIERWANLDIDSKFKNAATLAVLHREELVDKYGADAVSDFAFDKNGDFNERVISGGEVALAALKTVGISTALSLAGAPVALVSIPVGKEGRGSQAYLGERQFIKNEVKKAEAEARKAEIKESKPSTQEKASKGQRYTSEDRYNYIKNNKKEMYDRAAKNDKFDMEFIERYNSEKYDTHEKALKEYERFLDDPEKWMRNR